MKATELNPNLKQEFENTPSLKVGALKIFGVEFGTSKKRSLPYALITKDRNGSKLITTGKTVIGQLKSDFYQNLIKQAIDQKSYLEVNVEEVKAVPSGRPMLKLNIFS